MTHEVVVRNARLRSRADLACLGIDDGRIERIEPDIAAGETDVDAAGGLVTGGFVDCHVHLDKALVADSLPANESGTLTEAIERMQARKAEYTVGDVRERAIEAIRMHVRNGCTRIRTHVDVDTIGDLTPLEGVLEARDECDDIADVQVVAFPQEGLVQDPGTADLLDEALKRGADAIGGMPDNERREEDTQAHVDHCLELAQSHDVPVDMHVDETDDPSARSLEYLAARAIEEDIDDVTAGHTCALAAYDEPHARRVIRLLADAGMTLVTNPPTNLLLQGRHDQHPKRRGITRVDQLREAGLTVAAGQDCIRDAFYPYGRASMLETGLLTAHAAHLQAPEDRRFAWRTVTENAAAVMDVPYGIEEGQPATLNVFSPEVTTPTDAFRAGRPPEYVLHRGSVVAQNSVSSELV